MRRFSLKYALSQAFQGLWRNGVMSFASIAVLMSCLVVIGGFALIVLNINLNLNSLGNLNQIVVFVNEDMTEEDIVAVGEKIASLDNVDTVERITKNEALRQLKAQAGDKQDAYDYITDENNPLVDEFVISYSDPAKVVDLDYALKHMDGIAKVNNRLDLASQLESFRSAHDIRMVPCGAHHRHGVHHREHDQAVRLFEAARDHRHALRRRDRNVHRRALHP